LFVIHESGGRFIQIQNKNARIMWACTRRATQAANLQTRYNDIVAAIKEINDEFKAMILTPHLKEPEHKPVYCKLATQNCQLI